MYVPSITSFHPHVSAAVDVLVALLELAVPVGEAPSLVLLGLSLLESLDVSLSSDDLSPFLSDVSLSSDDLAPFLSSVFESSSEPLSSFPFSPSLLSFSSFVLSSLAFSESFPSFLSESSLLSSLGLRRSTCRAAKGTSKGDITADDV